MSILKRADLSPSDISQLADAVEPMTFADGESCSRTHQATGDRDGACRDKLFASFLA